MTLRGVLVVVALLTTLAGCGSSSVPSPPSGVDELTIPTPSPDPADFVAGVDNPWFPLPRGRTWTYDVSGVAGDATMTVTVEDGPEIDGVATTARVSVQAGAVVRDWFAQDAGGNVWWFGRAGEWQAGADGAEAGLAMPAHPRVGDGYRTGYRSGVVEDVATVLALDGSATVPAGSYDGLVVTRVTTGLEPAGPRELSWAHGIGLVAEDGPGHVVRLREVSG